MQKNTWRPFFGGHTKIRSSWSLWEKICRQKSNKNFSAKFGEIRAKILRTPKNLPAPTRISQVSEDFSIQPLSKILQQRCQSKREAMAMESVWQEDGVKQRTDRDLISNINRPTRTTCFTWKHALKPWRLSPSDVAVTAFVEKWDRGEGDCELLCINRVKCSRKYCTQWNNIVCLPFFLDRCLPQ